MGTRSGGSLRKRGSPSTSRVSFESALRLSFVRALSAARWAVFSRFLLISACQRANRSATSSRSYQTSIARMSAKPFIATR